MLESVSLDKKTLCNLRYITPGVCEPLFAIKHHARKPLDIQCGV